MECQILAFRQAAAVQNMGDPDHWTPQETCRVDHPSTWLSESHTAAHSMPFGIVPLVRVVFQKRSGMPYRPFSSGS
jgi:hypothetical protein